MCMCCVTKQKRFYIRADTNQGEIGKCKEGISNPFIDIDYYHRYISISLWIQAHKGVHDGVCLDVLDIQSGDGKGEDKEQYSKKLFD